jgi:hypothetical protein
MLSHNFVTFVLDAIKVKIYARGTIVA